MPLSVKAIADEISDQMRKNSLDVLTMRWPAFYTLCERDRMKESFLEALAAQLKIQSILLARGHAIVVFVKDFDFAPLR